MFLRPVHLRSRGGYTQPLLQMDITGIAYIKQAVNVCHTIFCHFINPLRCLSVVQFFLECELPAQSLCDMMRMNRDGQKSYS